MVTRTSREPKVSTLVAELRDVAATFIEVNELSRTMAVGSEERELARSVLRFQIVTMIDLVDDLRSRVGGDA